MAILVDFVEITQNSQFRHISAVITSVGGAIRFLVEKHTMKTGLHCFLKVSRAVFEIV